MASNEDRKPCPIHADAFIWEDGDVPSHITAFKSFLLNFRGSIVDQTWLYDELCETASGPITGPNTEETHAASNRIHETIESCRSTRDQAKVLVATRESTGLSSSSNEAWECLYASQFVTGMEKLVPRQSIWR